jgi:predicted lysophospholipase L1 biosynthesis ABC-type transport system permease subunit
LPLTCRVESGILFVLALFCAQHHAQHHLCRVLRGLSEGRTALWLPLSVHKFLFGLFSSLAAVLSCTITGWLWGARKNLCVEILCFLNLIFLSSLILALAYLSSFPFRKDRSQNAIKMAFSELLAHKGSF